VISVSDITPQDILPKNILEEFIIKPVIVSKNESIRTNKHTIQS
jgi:hypothetical protein